MGGRLQLSPNASGVHQLVDPAVDRSADLQQLGDWPTLNTDIDPLVVATFHNPPYTIVDPQDSQNVTGYLADLMSVLSEEIGFSIQYDINNTVGDFGVQRPDGTFSGLVGRLVDKKAHVGLAAMSWRRERQSVVDFVGKVPVAVEEINFYVPGRPQASMDEMESLLTPLDKNVWICLVCSMLVAAILLRVTVFVTRPRDPEDVRTFDAASSLLHVLGCVVQQSWASTPSSYSPRLVTLAARVLGILIYVEYTAVLVSVLTVLRVQTDIASVEEFVAMSDWSLLIQPGVAYTGDWKTSKEGALRTLYRRLEDNERIKIFAVENANQMFDGKTVTTFDRQQAFILLGAKACDLVSLPIERPINENEGTTVYRSQKKDPGFLVMQKNMKIKKEIDRVMLVMYQSGTLNSLFNRWFWNATNQECATSVSLRPLSFPELSAIVYMVPAGVVLSMAVLLLECLFVYCANSTDIYYNYREEDLPIKHDLWRM
ncbi:glutamate receptor 4-like isoform X1 [Amphibalanus amphitrite]|uniref:glutamate receptor 4-like isoform X1 n=1 Tax=Amphibalanus amphitrite TaxID=1232801 RepID=UPI001C90A52A|nr:glutamate receptor 4-like isoform X1 [Amphibalanus amphitrite]